jgi:hypothetical protein
MGILRKALRFMSAQSPSARREIFPMPITPNSPSDHTICANDATMGK